MRRFWLRGSPLVFVLSLFLALSVLPVFADPIVKDIADGDENSYMYGAGADEVLVFTSTATGDVNGDGLPDLIMGHDQGGTSFPFLYTGKVYVYYGRTSIDPDVDLGVDADVTINGWYVAFAGNSLACGDVDGDNIDDILIGCYLDSPGEAYAGGVAVIFGDASLPSACDFNTTPPDLYVSSANGGEYCGYSVSSGDIDGDGYDDILFGAPLGNGGVHYYDGTLTWSAQGGANADSLNGVSMVDATHGWAVGNYISAYDTLYYTDDGSTWQDYWPQHSFQVDFNGVSAYDTTHVWAVGESGTIAFYNGTSWAQQGVGVTTQNLRGVSAFDSSNVWAVGESGTIAFYNGTSWAQQGVGVTTQNLRGVSAAAANDVWAVGDGGTILHYDGSNWSKQGEGETTGNLWGVSAPTNSDAWAVGDGGTILHTSDGGSNWSPQYSETSEVLKGVSGTDANNCWAAGYSGTILKTSDGGSDWNEETTPFSQRQNGIDALDTANIWTVGQAASGRAYISWGRSKSAWSILPWSHASPIAPDKIINGINANDYCGVPVSLGNLNGDTRADMVIGSYEANGPGNTRHGAGEAYVVYGRNKGAFPYSISLAFDANCTVYGGSAMDGLPSSICRPLKNVNGDRYDDLVFGVASADGPEDDRAGCGEVDVIYGGNLPATIDLAGTAPDAMLYGGQPGKGVGFSVEVLDFNADDMNEITTGSPGAGMGTERPNCGVVWMADGREAWPATLDLGTSTDLLIYGAETNDAVGFCLSSANLNGDAIGYDDLVVSDPSGGGPGDTRPNCGEHFIFLGYDDVIPTCKITNVADGAILSGVVGVQVDATDFHGIAKVEFRVDGELQQTVTSTPYEWDWDTRDWEDGTTHTLHATAYDNGGNTASDSREVKINNSIPPLSDTWYLAEGTTAWGFEEYILVQNPNDQAIEATFTFMRPGGVIETYTYDVGANSRFTINVNTHVDNSDVSTRVEGTLPIICERAMYWNDRNGGHDSIGVINPSPTWYLAEGTTAFGFDEYILVQNPNADPVDVTMTFMKPGGITQEYDFSMAGRARYTVYVNDIVIESDVSTKVEASQPVICERSMYRWNKALGHDTIGTPSVSQDWYLAEGTTAWEFDTYILVQNPNPDQAVVDLDFMKPDGEVVRHGAVVPGQSRYTFYVNTLPGCEETDLSTHISSDQPVICERAMYWDGATYPGGHDTIGTPLPSDQWYLAEGTTRPDFEEYVLVQNPNTTQTTVSFTFMKPDGETVFYSLELAPESRFSLKVNDLISDNDVSTKVMADLPIICERAMYFSARNGGHDTIGVRGQ